MMRSLFLTGLLLVGLAVPCGAQVRGTIFGPGARNYPIAVSPLKALSPPGQAGGVGTRFADMVERDLVLSGHFKVVDRAAHIADPQASGYTADSINFPNWSVVGALGLVKGAFTVEGDHLTLEARLFDVYQRRQLTGRRYRGTIDDVRRMAHRFADEILLQFTGERGPFDSRIAFISRRGGRFKELYVMSLDGKDVQQLTRDGGITLSPSWSPDGRSLLYTSYKRRNPNLYSIDLFSGRETLISRRPGLNLAGSYAPDGTRIAVTIEEQGSTDIALIDVTGEVVRRLADAWAIDVSPTWSPDGRQIAFCSNRSGNPQIYVMDVDGGEPRRITFTGNYSTAPAWSPKGDRIAFVNRALGRFDIFTVRADGTQPRQLTVGQGDNEDPSWSPDGRYIVFSSTRTRSKKLFIMDDRGTQQVQLTAGEGDDSSPAWSGWLN
jgi:TolB protein